MQNEFTPGPWVARQEFANRWRIEVPREECVPLSVGLACTTVLEVGVNDADTEANAHLMAAAPEMFAALTLAEDVLSRFPYSAELWPNGTHPNAGITQIRAALAKARGEQ